MKTIQSTVRSLGKPMSWQTVCLDYLSLTKPRVVVLLLLSTVVALFLDSTTLPPLGLFVCTLIGGYLAAGGAGALNCALEQDIDHIMSRTGKRPVAAGRIPPHYAFRFGMTLSLLAFLILARWTTLFAAVLAMLGIGYYVLIYTHWLKRRTWLNIVIGGGAGALPPLVGSAAITGSLTPLSLWLAAIIFFWSPPHFWSLALIKRREYASACIPMLPVVAGTAATRRQIVGYSLGMVLLTLLVPLFTTIGSFYLLLALPLNGLFLWHVKNMYRDDLLNPTRSLFRYTIVYLALLFAAMLVDRVLVQVL
jgi:protoheme IX farnesyltransferase